MKKRILIIDDEEDFCSLFQKTLTGEDYEVITALSGKEGIEKIKEFHPDIIFLDLKMPKINGIETLGHLKRMKNNVPVVIFTAYPSMDTALKGHYLNIYDYMTKPFSLEKVRKVIKKALGESR
ncbi:MAG: response regulator [Chlamydiae bacterium]|nr:response regulator [Chlamydiota bacterium]MBI3276863.1 response regulator [Chlamydiota bacterium]